jgi:hypothetical protein
LKIVRYHYVGTGARRKDRRIRSYVYEYGKVGPDYGVYGREGLTCGEGHRISN